MKKIIDILHKNGIWKQDVLSVVHGLRPMIRFELNKEKYFILKKYLKFLKLNAFIYRSTSLNVPIVLIGKDKSHLLSAYSYIKNNKEDTMEFNQKLGEFLGYPSCCCDFFEQPKKIKDPVLEQKNNKEIDWKLNYLFNLDSREPVQGGSKVKEMNHIGYKGWNRYIVPYVPCSFECKKSLDYSKKLYGILKDTFPNYTLEIKNYLKNIVLYWNIYQFIVLDGKVNGNSIYYSKVLDINNLVDKGIFKKIKTGNRIVLGSQKIEIKKNDANVDFIGKGVKIFNFK